MDQKSNMDQKSKMDQNSKMDQKSKPDLEKYEDPVTAKMEECIICCDPIGQERWTVMNEFCCNAKIHLNCLEKTFLTQLCILLVSPSCSFCRKPLTWEDLQQLPRFRATDDEVDSDAETVVDDEEFNENEEVTA